MNTKTDVEYLIIGAGPAGVQLAYHLDHMGRDYRVLEASSRAGSFFETFPRHRTLISINKFFTGSDDPEFNMRHDWNSLLTDDFGHLFKSYDKAFFPSADHYVAYINDYVRKYRIKIRYGYRVARVSKREGIFSVRNDVGETITATYLIVATGVSKPLVPDIPGIELADNYMDMSIDRRFYENQRVLILGKANSAFETADHLTPAAAMIHVVSPSSISMAWKTHYVGHLRAINNNFLDTYQLKSQNAAMDAEVASISKVGNQYAVEFRYAHAEGEVETILYDRVLCCTGFRFDNDIFDTSCRPELVIRDKYPKIDHDFQAVNVPNLYFAGTITHSLDYRKATSGFIHGFRYNTRALARILNHRNHDVAWDSTPIGLDSSKLAEIVLARVNRAGGLWQQPGFIGDFVTLEGDQASYQYELPVEYIRTHADGLGRPYFVVTLEYGDPITGDPFQVERVHRQNIEHSERSQFLHPVVRHYSDGMLKAEHHVIEDLEARWCEDEHIDPLVAFFDAALGQTSGKVGAEGETRSVA